MACVRIAILVIAFVVVALVQTATALEEHTSLPHGPLKLVKPELTIAALPIEGLKASELRDNFEEIHNGHRHEAIDIMKPNGTPVVAVVYGTIRKLFVSKAAAIPFTNTMRRAITATTMRTWTTTRTDCMKGCTFRQER